MPTTSVNVTEYHVRDSLYHIAEEHLNLNWKKVIKLIETYVDRWSDVLLSTSFNERLLINDKDKDSFKELLGLTDALINKALKESIVIDDNWKRANNPFSVACIMGLRYAKLVKNESLFNAIAMYIAYQMYSSAHFNVWKKAPPKKEIVEYSINRLSNRYLIKQTGTIQGMLEITTLGALNGKYSDDLINCSDQNIADTIFGLKNRISSNVKYIADLIYEDHKSGNYIYAQSDSTDENNYHIADNKSYGIDRLARVTTLDILNSGFDENIIISSAVALNPGASIKKVQSMLDTILEEDKENISVFITDIVSLYIYKNPGNKINDCRTRKFLSEGLQIYKSNAQDDLTNKIKERLVYWLEISSKKYGKNFISRGKTSLDTYRRSIYTCFILKIIEVAKGGIN